MQIKPLKGILELPSDKSMTHRGIIFGAIAHGTTRVSSFHPGRDNLASLRAVQALGVETKLVGPAQIAIMAKEEGIANVQIDSSRV